MDEIETPGYQSKKKPGNERDTHFAGFAAKLWEKMMDLHNGIEVLRDGLDKEHEDEYKVLIAEWAYDLVYHVFASIPASFQSEHGDPPDCVKNIPDLIE